MNAAKVRHCLLAIASLTHGLIIASEGNETLDNISDKLTDQLLLGGKELEREANRFPVRLLVLDEFDTAQMLPVETDEKVIVEDAS